MNVLVTGAEGFVGHHLIQALRAEGWRVIGTFREGSETPEKIPEVSWIPAELTRLESVRGLVADADPDAIVHLAAASSVGRSWVEPLPALKVNVLGTGNLLSALAELKYRNERRTLLLVGSAEVYGESAGSELLEEGRPLRPNSPYGVSKAAQEMLGGVLPDPRRFRVVQTRSFPHVGPGQRPPFVLADWAQQLLSLRGLPGPGEIRVGNADVVRDYTDVRDAARAYLLLLKESTEQGIYNVCSGTGYLLRDLLDLLVEIVGVDVSIAVEPERLRRLDIPVLVGDPSRLRGATGWTPTFPIRQSLRDLVASMRDE